MSVAFVSRIARGAIACGLGAGLLLASGAVLAQDRDSVRDPARYVSALRQRNLISPVLQAQVEGVARVLAAQAAAGLGVQVNGDYDPAAINIYLVETGAAPALTGRLRGTFLAFPPQGLILGDAQYLAEVKAAADIYWHSVSRRDGAVKTYDALLIAKVEGPDDAVHARLGPRADWRAGSNELSDGAIAFLLAHEMGHLAIGIDPKLEDPIRLPHGLTGPDRDRFWACASLVGPQVAGTREQEAAADAYAARLLASLPAPTAPQRLRYEHGTLFLRNAEIGMVVAGLVTTWPRGQMLLDRAQLPINRDAVRAYGATLERDSGMIETVFPSSHPAQVNRMFGVYEVFAATPQSAYYGGSDQHDAQMWQLLIQLMCASIQPAR